MPQPTEREFAEDPTTDIEDELSMIGFRIGIQLLTELDVDQLRGVSMWHELLVRSMIDFRLAQTRTESF